jgi:hypothetical protein
MRRLTMGVPIVLAILLVAEIRLSRSDPQLSEPPPPALWSSAQPPGRPSPSRMVTRSAGAPTVAYPNPVTNCPTVVSIDPNSQYTFTGVLDGVLFDIDGDGDLDQVAWTKPSTDVAFLALDRDGDGRITSGRELIGDHTLPGITNGPDALLQLAVNPATKALLDSDDLLFSRMRLWRDANHNGSSEPAELRAAGDELSTIGLGYERHRRIDSHGNQSRFRGFVHVRTAVGQNRATTPQDDRTRRRYMYDVCLVSLDTRNPM